MKIFSFFVFLFCFHLGYGCVDKYTEISEKKRPLSSTTETQKLFSEPYCKMKDPLSSFAKDIPKETQGNPKNSNLYVKSNVVSPKFKKKFKEENIIKMQNFPKRVKTYQNLSLSEIEKIKTQQKIYLKLYEHLKIKYKNQADILERERILLKEKLLNK